MEVEGELLSSIYSLSDILDDLGIFPHDDYFIHFEDELFDYWETKET